LKLETGGVLTQSILSIALKYLMIDFAAETRVAPTCESQRRQEIRRGKKAGSTKQMAVLWKSCLSSERAPFVPLAIRAQQGNPAALTDIK
jgi:hypothetical protein